MARGVEKYFPTGGRTHDLAARACNSHPLGSSLICTREKGHTGIHIAATRYYDVDERHLCGWWREDGVLRPKETTPDFPEAQPERDPERILGRALLVTYVAPEPKGKPVQKFWPGDRVKIPDGRLGKVRQSRITSTRGKTLKVVLDDGSEGDFSETSLSMPPTSRRGPSGRRMLVDK